LGNPLENASTNFIFDSVSSFSVGLCIDGYASSAADSCSNHDGDSHPERYTAASHRNAIPNDHANACAKL
jgi:hypothetical protein